MAASNLEHFLSEIEAKLASALIPEIDLQADSLENGCYGYALLPGDTNSITSIVAAYNLESDVSDEHRQDTYYRYSVDEWKNYLSEGFDSTNGAIEQLNAEFRRLHPDDPTRYVMDDVEVEYIRRLLDSILAAMRQSRMKGALSRFEYAVIWIADSSHEIMHRSASKLNSEAIYERFVSEFKP